MSGQVLSFKGVGTASGACREYDSGEAPRFDLSACAGRLVEISGAGNGAALSFAVQLVWQAQREGEPVAWVTTPRSCFFPPDVEESGVDLSALAIIRVADKKRVGRAADHLIRSSAFGLVVLDLGAFAQIPLPMQGRLLGLSQKHDTALVCLTEKTSEAPSLGSMVSLRAAAFREPLRNGRFRCKVRVLKDKLRGPHWSDEMVMSGPTGLR